MLNLNEKFSSVVANSMIDYFNNEDIHRKSLDSTLQSRLGENACVNVKAIACEAGGNMVLGFDMKGIYEELVNFSDMVAKKLNITEEEANESILKCIRLDDISVDITWTEEPKVSDVSVYIGYNKYEDVNPKCKSEESRNILLKTLQESILEFVDTTMNNSIKLFTQCWIYEYNTGLNYNE